MKTNFQFSSTISFITIFFISNQASMFANAQNTACPPYDNITTTTPLTSDTLPEIATYLGISVSDYEITPEFGGPNVGQEFWGIIFPLATENNFISSMGDLTKTSFRSGTFNYFSYSCAAGKISIEVKTSNQERIEFSLNLTSSQAVLTYYNADGTKEKTSPHQGVFVPDGSILKKILEGDKKFIENKPRYYLKKKHDGSISIRDTQNPAWSQVFPLDVPAGIATHVVAQGQYLVFHANGKIAFHLPGGGLGFFENDSRALLFGLDEYIAHWLDLNSKNDCGGNYKNHIEIQMGSTYTGYTSSVQALLEDYLDKDLEALSRNSTVFTSNTGKSTLLIDANGVIRPGKGWKSVCSISSVEKNENSKDRVIQDESGSYMIIFDVSKKTYTARELGLK